MRLTIPPGKPILGGPVFRDWGDFTTPGHSVQLYEADGFLLEGLRGFIGAALLAGDAGVVIATKAHRDGLAERLDASGIELGPAQREGRYVSLDAAATLAEFMRDGWPDPELFFSVIGDVIERTATSTHGVQRRRIAAFGEMVALLWAEGHAEAAIRLEQLWNELSQRRQFYLHCAYPKSFFGQFADPEPLRRVCAEHTRVIAAES